MHPQLKQPDSLNFTCRECKSIHPRTTLSPSKIKRFDFSCRKCSSAAVVAWMKSHPETVKRYHKSPKMKATRNRHTKRISIKRRTTVNRLKQRPCTDCQGWFEPCQMQFDHLDAATKMFNLSRAKTQSLQRILEEAHKCEVVCANCHALRTERRRIKVAA